MKRFFYIIFTFFSCFLVAQISGEKEVEAKKDTILTEEVVNTTSNKKDSVNTFTPTAKDYKLFKSNLDTIVIVKDFSINNFYKKNFTGKDYFGRMVPNNIGKAFNELSYFPQENPIGNFLPVGKKYNFQSEKDIRYFDVKTPSTELDYESGIKEGQALSTVFTHSPNNRINYSIQYRGLRSTGRYLSDFAANNSFVLGFSLRNKKNNYKVLTHYAVQNIDNQENGGLSNRALFDINNSLYRTRTALPVNLENIETKFFSRRVFLKQIFTPFNSNKKLNKINFNNTFSLEENQLDYKEGGVNNFFSTNVFSDISRQNRTTQLNIENKFGVSFKNEKNSSLEVGYLFTQINYNLLERTNTVEDKLKNTFNGVYASFNNKILNVVDLNSTFQYSLNPDFKSPYQLKVELKAFKDKKIELFSNYFNQSAIPRFNAILNQSFYKDYNYYNPNFENENTQLIELGVNATSLKTSLSASLNKIENHIYFTEDNLPKQLKTPIQIVTINLENALKFKKINLVSTIRYQQIDENKKFLPLPSFIARTTLFYQSPAFKKNAEIQTGININYFSAFESREISPLNNEFKLQNSKSIYSIGNVPMVDYFLNIKTKRMDVFLKLENISSMFTKSYYVLPNIPYTDWRIRAGIKWYLFG